MQRIINHNKEITIKEIENRLFTNENLIILYYTNSTEAYPVFLKRIDDHYGFSSPFFSYSYTFQSETPINSIKKAIIAGNKVFVIQRDELSTVFKKKSSAF